LELLVKVYKIEWTLIDYLNDPKLDFTNIEEAIIDHLNLAPDNILTDSNLDMLADITGPSDTPISIDRGDIAEDMVAFEPPIPMDSPSEITAIPRIADVDRPEIVKRDPSQSRPEPDVRRPEKNYRTEEGPPHDGREADDVGDKGGEA
jgi:hypothetical protein